MSANEYNGFALFNDVEDKELQAFNRGRVMTNIYVDNQQDGNTNVKGSGLIIGYFSKIDPTERAAAQAAFVAEMKKEGFVLEQ